MRLVTEVVPSATDPFRRLQAAAEIVYAKDYCELDEVEVQIAKSKELMVNTLALSVISQCPDGSGVSWKSFTKILTDILAAPELQAMAMVAVSH